MTICCSMLLVDKLFHVALHAFCTKITVIDTWLIDFELLEFLRLLLNWRWFVVFAADLKHKLRQKCSWLMFILRCAQCAMKSVRLFAMYIIELQLQLITAKWVTVVTVRYHQYRVWRHTVVTVQRFVWCTYKFMQFYTNMWKIERVKCVTDVSRHRSTYRLGAGSQIWQQR